jgi:hypothetical protein
MTSQALVSGLRVGRKIHVQDIGWAEVTKVQSHEFHCEGISGIGSGETFAFPTDCKCCNLDEIAAVLEWE